MLARNRYFSRTPQSVAAEAVTPRRQRTNAARMDAATSMRRERVAIIAAQHWRIGTLDAIFPRQYFIICARFSSMQMRLILLARPTE